jgi:hypothetical protein
MAEIQLNRVTYPREVLLYHSIPVVAAFTLTGSFFGIFFLSRNYLIASFLAAIPCVFLLRRWAVAGRRIESWGCPKCGHLFPKKINWSYPPRVCPGCGESVRD